MSAPGCCLMLVTSAAMSPESTVVGCHSGRFRVLDATYFWVLFRCAAIGSVSGWCGQNAAIFSKVLRPNRNASVAAIPSPVAWPCASSKYGADHPPYANPPSVSSSGDPRLCMTPSKVMNSTATMLRMRLPFPR